MAADYTVIQPVRQRFGDNVTNASDPEADWHEYPIEINAPFVGVSKDFPFSCPSVDRSEWGVLQFGSLGSYGGNTIQVNGVDVPGGISMGPTWWAIDPHVPLWTTHHLLVEPGVLAEENVLHIAATPDQYGKGHDDFIIDNVVIWFKTSTGDRPPIGGVSDAKSAT
jgi:hypothetical protein